MPTASTNCCQGSQEWSWPGFQRVQPTRLRNSATKNDTSLLWRTRATTPPCLPMHRPSLTVTPLSESPPRRHPITPAPKRGTRKHPYHTNPFRPPPSASARQQSTTRSGSSGAVRLLSLQRGHMAAHRVAPEQAKRLGRTYCEPQHGQIADAIHA